MSRKFMVIIVIIAIILSSFSVILIVHYNEGKNKSIKGEIAVVVYSGIYDRIKKSLNTLEKYSGYKFIVKTITYENPKKIREWLKNEYIKRNIQGALLVGNIPLPKYENLTTGEVMDFPYFYMDLNGRWIDKNGNGIIDTPGGNNKPEIWVGIVRSVDMNGNDIDEINKYLWRTINYLRGDIYSEPKSLEFMDNDFFVEQGDVYASLKFLYPYVKVVYGNDANKRSLENSLKGNYSYGFFGMHSNGWDFFLKYNDKWEKITPEDFIRAHPRILFYTLSSCYAGDFEKGELANKVLMESRAMGIITYSNIAYVNPMTSMFMQLAKNYSIGKALLYYIDSLNFSVNEFNMYIAPLMYLGIPFLKMWKPHGYKEVRPFVIKGNTELLRFKKIYGWQGDGSKNDPIRISGLLIFRNTTYGISFYGWGFSFVNITLHVVISNSYILIGQMGRDAIDILNSRNVMIENCILFGGGIFVQNSSYIKIENNIIENAWDGISLSGEVEYNTSSSIIPTIQKVYYAHQIVVVGNRIYNGGGIGMDYINDSLVQYNFVKSYHPFSLYRSNHNLIRWNTFKNVSFIYIRGAHYNFIYGNDFYGNLINIFITNSTNYWNTTNYGNYWEMWANKNNTNDKNGDGIVDYPFVLDKNNIDRYPLKNPYKYSQYKSKNGNENVFMSMEFFVISTMIILAVLFAIFGVTKYRRKSKNK